MLTRLLLDKQKQANILSILCPISQQKHLTNLLAELSKGHIVSFTEWLPANS